MKEMIMAENKNETNLNDKIRNKILSDLESDKADTSSENIPKQLAKRYDVPEQVVIKIIAEWEAGHKK